MSSFRYLLTMTTSGRRECFDRTVDSFSRMVFPAPAAIYIWDDGRKTGVQQDLSDTPLHAPDVRVEGTRRAKGFCEATAQCWDAADSAYASVPWAFHLEDDFEIVRAIDLEEIAHVMSLEPNLKQMALMRDAVNERERLAGGLVLSRPGEFTRMGAGGGTTWLRHRSYWTTNPSLFRTRFAHEFPWPRREQHCEGIFTHELLAAMPQAVFGAWGVGDAWCHHIGVRAGSGY